MEPRAAAHLKLPTELADHPQFEILRELGRGGMGVVYLARNRLMGRLEVLKVVNEHMLDRSGGKERFLREIQAAGMLSHPNVVAAYSATQLGELLVFAMEYVEGEDLAQFVKRIGPLPVPVACYYTRQAALGLQHAFEKKMVHRDIKPQNLILFRDGKNHVVKVLDFGLAKLASAGRDEGELTGTGKMLGTPDYIAPEQMLDAARADIRADIYSLGCTLYYLLTGAPPFKASSLFEVLAAHQALEPRPLNLARPEVPEELAAVVRRMLAKEPAQRYQTPADVAQALVPFITTEAKGVPAGFAPALPQGTVVVEPAEQDTATSRARPPAVNIKEPQPVKPEPRPAVARARSRAAKPAPKQRRLIAAGVLASLALVGFIGLWAGGLFKVKTKDGTVTLEPLAPDPVGLARSKNEIPPAKAQAAKPVEQVRKPARDDKGFVPLFNGKDLAGWERQGNANAVWKVEDGVLIGRWLKSKPTEQTTIFTKRSDYQNFRFRVETTPCELTASSMVFLWTGGPKTGAKQAGPDGWYRAQIGTFEGPDMWETGALRQRLLRGKPLAAPKAPVKLRPGEWFTQEVVVEGKSIRIYVNDVLTTEYELRERSKPGHLGISLAGGATIRIRKIEVQELPAPKPITAIRESPPLQPAATAKTDAFVPLFNGKNLTGWVVDSGDEQAWQVKDEELVVRGTEKNDSRTQGYLLSTRDYSDFILRFQFQRSDDSACSGIALRALSHETARASDPGLKEDFPFHLTAWLGKYRGNDGTGALWWSPNAASVPPLLPDQQAELKPIGEWNDMEVEMRGQALRVGVNGREVLNVKLNQTRPLSSPAPGLKRYKGRIGFLKRNGEVRFRNIEVKELQPAEPDAAGFVPLFNGKDLTGWAVNDGGNLQRWGAANGVLYVEGQGGGWLMTEKEYTNFELRLEYKLPAKANSGVALRSPMQGDPARVGMEIQLLDDDWFKQNPQGLRDVQRTGAIYDVVPPSIRALNPVGQWNAITILAQDRRVRVVLNGTTIVDTSLDDYKHRAAEHPGLLQARGHIGLQGHDARCEFRNISIKELPPAKTTAE